MELSQGTGVIDQDSLSTEAEFLVFRLGGEEYAIDILRVQEIRGYDAVTRLANSPEFIKGVINLRGVIVPIIDLRIKFSHPAEYNTFTVLIILNVLDRQLGIVVDGVSDVVAFNRQQIRPAPQFSSSFDTRYIRGMASLEERMIIVTDIEKLMSAEEMALINTVSA
ncbi:chemotaxis protein CheW [Azonexus sp. IMCC34839]|uniref:chemotaxis protein CheW n=1 Tax=Azonexus sp. IMCC34839 TaxID=3133695 RepID=UPI00399BAEB5